MSWFDAGVNLLDARFDVDTVLSDASAAQVNEICVIASHVQESIEALALVEHYAIESKRQLYCTAGVHPHYADGLDKEGMAQLASLVSSSSVGAVGECGLDFNRNFSTPQNQLKAFEYQLELAQTFQKPVYLHERDAFDSQIGLLQRYLPNIPKALVHCFTGTSEQVKAYLSLDCYIGITGWICDPKRGADLREAIKHIPLDKLVLETDAPYLFPKTLKPRQKHNYPSNLPYIGHYISQLLGIPETTLRAKTTENARALFTSTRK